MNEIAPHKVEPPFLVALNLTRRCNLACAHCYLDAGSRCDQAANELSTDEARDCSTTSPHLVRRLWSS